MYRIILTDQSWVFEHTSARDGGIRVKVTRNEWSDGVAVAFQFHGIDKMPYEAVSFAVHAIVKRNGIRWLEARRKQWRIDLDLLKEYVPELKEIDWFTGSTILDAALDNQVDLESRTSSFDTTVTFFITRDHLEHTTYFPQPPTEILESLSRFQLDHPNPRYAAFVMMQFGQTRAHTKIFQAIRQTLESMGIIALRADDKEYHEDLISNVLTYLHGCSFGIAVFERLETDDFNPNVSLEVGHMQAMRKPVCLLKDKTLSVLNADLSGKLYRTFDPQDPMNSVPDAVRDWVADKGLAL